jgi:prophage antirepressor-like protein|nr:MAG TPA: repressor domain protein [Caudoviricetes sp.]
MNEMRVFNNPEFGDIRTVTVNEEPWFVLKDVCEAFGETNYRRVAGRLEDDEKGVSQISTPGGKQNMTIVNESGLYSALFAMQPEKARGVCDEYIAKRQAQLRQFKRWVTAEVLPSIRKTGGYMIPQDYPSALRALADAEEQKLKLLAENQRQAQAIADFEPIRQYVDEILESQSAMATSQVAADYDLSAKALNKILYEAGIQRNVNGQWILYKRYMGKGYTKSKTIQFIRSDGRYDSTLQTQWTQKGRMLIHEVLTSRGIQAVMDRKPNGEEGRKCRE